MGLTMKGGTFDFTYLSLGAGWQSTALLVLACTDPRVPKPDAAIFADTGDEPPWIYDDVARLTSWAAGHGLRVHVARHKSGQSLRQFSIDRQKAGGKRRFVSLPLFTKNADGSRGILRRQCTAEFKLRPIERKVRDLLGYRPRQRWAHKVRALVGISVDEIARIKPAREHWLTKVYPLVDLGVHRRDCRDIVTAAGLPAPRKSACIFCPFHSDGYWLELKRDHPEVFAEAVQVDRDVRDATAAGRKRPAFLHSSLQPLEDVEFGSQLNAFSDFDGECGGSCGL